MGTHSLKQQTRVNDIADIGQGEGRLSERVREDDPASEGWSRGHLQSPFIRLVFLLGLGVRVRAGPLALSLAIVDVLRGPP